MLQSAPSMSPVPPNDSDMSSWFSWPLISEAGEKTAMAISNSNYGSYDEIEKILTVVCVCALHMQKQNKYKAKPEAHEY